MENKFKYENSEVVKQPTIEKPKGWQYYNNETPDSEVQKQRLTHKEYIACQNYENHIKNLRRYPVPPEYRHVWKEGEDVTGKFKVDTNCRIAIPIEPKLSQEDEMIQAIRKTTEEACKSPESARKFLVDAGIIEQDHPLQDFKQMDLLNKAVDVLRFLIDFGDQDFEPEKWHPAFKQLHDQAKEWLNEYENRIDSLPIKEPVKSVRGTLEFFWDRYCQYANTLCGQVITKLDFFEAMEAYRNQDDRLQQAVQPNEDDKIKKAIDQCELQLKHYKTVKLTEYGKGYRLGVERALDILQSLIK